MPSAISLLSMILCGFDLQISYFTDLLVESNPLFIRITCHFLCLTTLVCLTANPHNISRSALQLHSRQGKQLIRPKTLPPVHSECTQCGNKGFAARTRRWGRPLQSLGFVFNVTDYVHRWWTRSIGTGRCINCVAINPFTRRITHKCLECYKVRG